MKALRFYDSQRTVWTIGAGSGKWYRLVNNQWQSDGTPAGELVATIQKGWQHYMSTLDQGARCLKCGHGLPDSARFCLNCGTTAIVRTETDRTTVFCRHCGSRLAAEARFCNHCGQERQ
ncbi:MAG: zinc ribbon domain-containing protein [Dehalogenimonas sp.]|uniref:Zinc ribbon domain-containing protein n=1 Tax=Candidatus Dehalogenimonas loeffleri TaxID=3127115 RepID=A0ABZ2J4T9_9CHLR|nr:zinc ribbon domain-containing protein [Dehalogenimonas sp.]